ncbi:ABC transporter permease [Spiroplasma endosymbiont of Polydrusus cervinus]|uniref:ABC transporter permease n=1 Tax=Spiroplasma endosymbiont of Polydrusus cervinus TaxID=3066287 RepID=UPI0030D5CACC
MRSDDIKILKIKPIKRSVLKDQNNDQQDLFLSNKKATFLQNENSHFFKNNYYSSFALPQNQIADQNNDLNAVIQQARNITLNLDNPDALNILHNQTEKLKQEKINFHQRLNKIKSTFDEKDPLYNEKYLHEPPVIIKKINLINFNNKNNTVVGNDPAEKKIERVVLEEQARAVAQKIMQKDQQKKSQSLTNPVDNNQRRASKPLFPKHLSNFSSSKATQKKDVFFTQSYNKPPLPKAIILPKEEDKISSKLLKGAGELNQDNSFAVTGKEMLKAKQDINFLMPSEQNRQLYDETETMEWDITKRPNLGVEQTTNKYYHQEEKKPQQAETFQMLQGKENYQKEILRAVELEEIDGTYQIDNFYAKLFNSNINEHALNQKGKIKTKKIRGKKKKQLNPNEEKLAKKQAKFSVQATTIFNNNYQVQQLSNGRQRITKINKNNIIKWRYPIILAARLMAIIGLIALCSTFLLFNNWVNNSALDLYNFIEVNFGKLDFIAVKHHYFFINRIFMLTLIGIYAVIGIFPFCLVSNFKMQLYCFLPLNLIFLCGVIGIALYGYFFMNINFNWINNILQIISYSFLLLANLLMVIGIFSCIL